MNRVYIVALCAALVLTLSLATAAQAEKPLAVLSLCSQQSAVGQSADLTYISEAKDLPTYLASMFKLYAEGQGANGLDGSRPWGAAFTVGAGLEGYCFVPVTDAQALSMQLEQFIDQVTPVEGNLYRIVGKQPNQELYAVVTDRWLFASNSKEALANLPSDPATLLGGLEKQFDVAFRVNAESIPASERYMVGEKLGDQMALIVEQIGSNRTMEVVKAAMEQLDSITLGWRSHKK